jgi:hypothetical protein
MSSSADLSSDAVWKAMSGAIDRLHEKLSQAKARELDLIVTIARLWEVVKRFECTDEVLPDLVHLG